LQNAAGVVALLYLAGWVRDVQKINQGLRQVTLAGRMQWLNVGASRWLLDVAHNPQSLDVLVETLQRENWQFDAVIFAQMQDKDVIKGLNLLMRAPSLKTAQWLLPDVRFERALPPNRLESLFPEGVRVKTFDSVESAVCFARDSSECPCARVLVMGSFYLIGPVLAQVSEGYLHG
jgi:folylpolyglutamate synthase/dihydropteroate synthase